MATTSGPIRSDGGLLAWSRDNRRDLPWRRTRDPWAVLVSELMLQQTQVARVVPRYEAFLARFPTPAACAAGALGDVVRMWAGLGYNRRAVNLHRAATAVVERHGGALPDDLDALLALPGVGAYTARAVLAFAFERDVGVLDVNAARVLARAWGDASQATADAAVPPGEGWAWNQAMLDLGATVCTRRPVCRQCPLAGECRWQLAGCPEPDPAGPAPRQSAFLGSDRQGRGRLVGALRRGPVRLDDVAEAAGWPADRERANRIASALVRDGLIELDAGWFRLPSTYRVDSTRYVLQSGGGEADD
jgi:A/G-specific adenine glycosylase